MGVLTDILTGGASKEAGALTGALSATRKKRASNTGTSADSNTDTDSSSNPDDPYNATPWSTDRTKKRSNGKNRY